MRITKVGGYIGIGVDHFEGQEEHGLPESSPRVNHLNSSEHIIQLFKEHDIKVIYDYNHENAGDDAIGIIVKLNL